MPRYPTIAFWAGLLCLLGNPSPSNAANCGPTEKTRLIALVEARTQVKSYRVITAKKLNTFGNKLYRFHKLSLENINAIEQSIRVSDPVSLRRNMKIFFVLDQAMSTWGRDVTLGAITSVGPASGYEGAIGKAIGESITNGRFDTYNGCWFVYGGYRMIYFSPCHQTIKRFMQKPAPKARGKETVCSVFRELITNY
jgi:hypothetical protein